MKGCRKYKLLVFVRLLVSIIKNFCKKRNSETFQKLINNLKKMIIFKEENKKTLEVENQNVNGKEKVLK